MFATYLCARCRNNESVKCTFDIKQYPRLAKCVLYDPRSKQADLDIQTSRHIGDENATLSLRT